jgi:hypothetical protein
MADLPIDWQAKVRQVRRRQFLQALLWRLPWTLTAALLGAAVWLLSQPHVQAWVGPERPVQLEWWGALAAAGGAGLLLALLLTAWRRPTLVGSALALDEAFDLKERVTTAISLREDQKATPAGIALLEDIRSRIDRLDVASRFPLSLSRSAALVPAAGGLFALVALFWHPTIAQPTAEAQPEVALKTERPDPAAAAEIRKNNQDRRQKLADLHSEKLDNIMADLDRITDKIEKPDKQADLQPTLQQMSKMAEDIRERQAQLAKIQDIQRQLRRDQGMKNNPGGPGKDLQEALAKGDFDKARKELQRLADRMKSGNLSDKEKKDLAKDLKDLKEKLKNLADQKERKERVQNSDLDPEAKKKELAKIDRECQGLSQLKDLADKLDDLSNALAEGDESKLNEFFKDLQDKVDELTRSEDEIQALQDMLAELEKLKGCLG